MTSPLFVGLAGMLLGAAPTPPVAQTAQAASPRAFCEAGAWRAMFGDGHVCVPARFGVAIAPAEQATGLASTIDEASDRYTVHFMTPQSPVAVVAGATLSAEQAAFLNAGGFRMLPWVANAQRRSTVETMLRQQLKQRDPSLSDDQLSAKMTAMLAQVSSTSTSGDIERGALSHELGHLWFRALFDADRPAVQGTRMSYGSSSPDWIDEMAAVLGENDTLTLQRRAQLGKYAMGQGVAGLYPLSDYLNMEHPVVSAIAANKVNLGGSAEPQGGPRLIVLSGDEAAKVSSAANDPIRFYVQSRAFADFMIERTGDRTIFRAIAEALRSGQTFETWLASQGAAHRLPADLAGVDAAWRSWVTSRASATPA